jgi:glycosyltransferase involved in cell wall biosynthesis
VVVRDLPPLAEAVGAAGLVAPPEPGAWAEAARGALARREAWGEAGRRRLEERFSARRQAESYRALYGELLDAAGCPADERGSAA